MRAIEVGNYEAQETQIFIFSCHTTGINIVLISRTQSRLDEAAKEIGNKYNVKTKILAVDFGKADAATWSTLKAEVRLCFCGCGTYAV